MHRAEDLVAGESGFHGDFRRFGIANFTDHDDVRILPQNRTQRVGKRKANILFHRHLIDPRDLEFNRILDRHDVIHRIIQLV